MLIGLIVVCALILLIAAGAIALQKYDGDQVRALEKHKFDTEQTRSAKSWEVKDELAATRTFLGSLLSEIRDRMDCHAEDLQTLRDRHVPAPAHDQETAAALLALSERVSIFEAALKEVLAQMVNVSGYTAEKHKQMLAATVRGQQVKPGRNAQ